MATDHKLIYLDHNATTPVCKAAVEEINKQLNSFGNPSSSHSFGKTKKEALNGYRKSVADAFAVSEAGVVFMSGGTEVNNSVIQCSVQAFGKRTGRVPWVVTSRMEHPATLQPLLRLQAEERLKIYYLPICRRSGRIYWPSKQDLPGDLLDNLALVTIMLANNETGVLQPLETVFDAIKNDVQRQSEFRPVLHSDASQAIGRVPFSLETLNCDVITVTGHKFGAPCIGAMVARDGYFPGLLGRYPLLLGGGQENGLRHGTENVPMIAGLSVALDWAINNLSDFDVVKSVRDRLEARLIEECGAVSHFRSEPRLPNTASMTFPSLQTNASELLLQCETVFAASTGAACHADEITVSPCLLACGLSERDAMRTVRFSLGRENSFSDVDAIVAAVKAALLNGT